MKKKDENLPALISGQELQKIEDDYAIELETNPKFSLEVDPTDIYHMPEKQKEFIKWYVQFKNVPLACQLCEIDEREGKSYFMAFSSQQEIRRINMAMYHRQFASKLLSIDEVGGYLSSLLVDANVPISERLPSKDKLKVAQMIIDLNMLKQKAINEPQEVDAIDITEQIKDLSVKSIKQLIDNSKSPKTAMEKEDIIDAINSDNRLTIEEVAYLRTLPLGELLDLLEKGNS